MSELLPLTVPEVRRLLWSLLWRYAPEAREAVAWSHWRRRHQRRAQLCHYRRRGSPPPT